VTCGVRFRHGYHFRGPEYRQFAHRHWGPTYRTSVYSYAGTRAWYHWSGAQAVYYPLSYAAVVPPAGEPPADVAPPP
jgi:hypothetical protein